MMQLRSGAATGPGRVRQVNQDRYLVFDNRLFVVADGMGGHRGGEVAAQLTVDTLNVANDVQSSDDLQAAIVEANRTIFQHAADDPELSGMGTTITAIALLADGDTHEPLLSIANVGDSRTYRLTPAGFEQLTEDHSVIGELMRDGRITAEEALQHRHRSVITRALGVEPSVEVDIVEVIPTPGDRYLLCSDGLYSEVADPAIASILRRFADPNEACEELLAAAITRGGRDNITAIIVDVVDDTDPAYVASQALGTLSGATPAIANTSSVGAASEQSAGAKTKAVKSPSPKTPKVKRARKPSPINLRVLLFIAVLAGLGAIVAWVWKNAPEEDILPTTVVVTTDSSVPAGPVVPNTGGTGASTTPGSTNPAESEVSTTKPTAKSSTQSTAKTSGAAGASTTDSTVVTRLAPTTTDPFGDPVTSKTATTRKK